MSEKSTNPVPRTRFTWLAVLTGLTALAILVQAITAGEFVSQRHRTNWIDIHGMTADAVDALALITAIFTIVALRHVSTSLVWATVILLILVVVQTFIGHEITDNNQNWLIGIHVPLALIIFGIAVWLPIQGRMLRRANTTAA